MSEPKVSVADLVAAIENYTPACPCGWKFPGHIAAEVNVEIHGVDEAQARLTSVRFNFRCPECQTACFCTLDGGGKWIHGTR